MRKKESFVIEYPDDESPKKPAKQRFSALLSFNIFDVADSVAYALVAVAIAFILFFRVFGVHGASMEPTLADGQRVMVSVMGYSPKAGDVVVVSETPGYSESLIKRVIAGGGDTVDINFATGKVYVNGVELSESYTNSPTYRQYNIAFPVTVPEGCVFILGDNRENSLDSRTSLIGCVDEDFIIGKVLFRFDFGNWSIYND